MQEKSTKNFFAQTTYLRILQNMSFKKMCKILNEKPDFLRKNLLKSEALDLDYEGAEENYLIVDVSLIRAVGIIPATLHAFLLRERRKLSDGDGWLSETPEYFLNFLNLDKKSFMDAAEILVENGFVIHISSIKPKREFFKVFEYKEERWDFNETK